MSGTGQAYGQAQPEDSATDYAQIDLHIRSALARLRTNVAVKVISCSNSGTVAPTGTVSVQPQVSMIDGAGNSTPHGIVNNLPYFRLQGGNNAIICDPVAGDFGWVAVCDRDISAFKNAKAVSNPGSWRQFDFADSIYIGGMLNGTPTCYIQFESNGITIPAPTGLEVTGDLTTLGSLSAGNGVTGSFTSGTGQIVTVQNGIVTSIA